MTIQQQPGGGSSNGQSFFIGESIVSSNQHRPSTGSHGGSNYHKTMASVSTKLNANSRVSQQANAAA